MDFNKSFLSYDGIDGAKCQTTDKSATQKDAAIEAVKKIGLNQISEIKNKWFINDTQKEMFYNRLELLKENE